LKVKCDVLLSTFAFTFNLRRYTVVDHVMPFIQANISSTEWRLREAATFAFGSILEVGAYTRSLFSST
jgi:hypothetical protein